MRNFVLAAAAAVLAVAAPAVASAQVTGYAGAVYNSVDPDPGSDEDVYGVEGSAFFAATDKIGVEVDAAVLDGDDTDTAYGLVAHVFTRNDQYLVGGYVGAADSDDDDTTWQVGLEGNKYFERWTASASLGYAEGDDVSAYGVNVGASLFATDNLRFDVGVSYANVDPDAAADDDALGYGVGVEYQLASFPVSFGASISHNEFDDSNSEADVIGVVVRYNFGGGTLLDRDRNGASQANRVGLGSALAL